MLSAAFSKKSYQPLAIHRSFLFLHYTLCAALGQWRARTLFAKNNVRVVIGAREEAAEATAKGYLKGTLQTGANICDH
jgi:hypothetical protein